LCLGSKRRLSLRNINRKAEQNAGYLLSRFPELPATGTGVGNSTQTITSIENKVVHENASSSPGHKILTILISHGVN